MAMDFLMRNLMLPDKFGQGDVDPTNTFLTEDNRRMIQRLSRLNVLIGPNNCGKSRLLRELFRNRAPHFTPATDSIIEYDRLCDRWLIAVETVGHNHVEDTVALDKIKKAIRLTGPPLNHLKGFGARETDRYKPLRSDDTLKSALDDITNVDGGLNRSGFKAFSNLLARSESEAIAVGERSPHRVYIPSIRSMRPLGGRTVLAERLKAEHFTDDKSVLCAGNNVSLRDANILCGPEFYEGIKEYLLGDRKQRDAIREFENYLGRVFFDGSQVTITPRHGQDVLFLRVGNEADRAIHHLGDGLSNLIMLTLPLFLNRDRDLLLFVEEPELYLHPGFQRAFIDAVLDLTGNTCHQVFVATHSHQFLDITIDRDLCTVYRVEKRLRGETDQQATHRITLESNDNRPILRELGVRNSSVLLSNCTIWVEGIYDRLYFRHYLNLLQKNLPPGDHRFLEDVHFSFVEYSGSNITHWSFLNAEMGMNVDRLCSRLMLIADSDNATEGKKKERHEQLARVLGDRFVLLNCREVENLLTPETLKAVIRDYGDGDVGVKDFVQEDYRDDYLGDFIETEALNGTSTRSVDTGRSYATESGTIKDKDAFCRKALSHIKSIDDMSLEAKSVCKRIYDFIAENNK